MASFGRNGQNVNRYSVLSELRSPSPTPSSSQLQQSDINNPPPIGNNLKDLKWTGAKDQPDKELLLPSVVFSGPMHEGEEETENIPDDIKTTRIGRDRMGQGRQGFATEIPPKVYNSKRFGLLGTVYSKWRKFVVIKHTEFHMICLPIYTHRGEGLSGKNKKDFCEIRHKYAPGEQEGEHERLWVEVDLSLWTDYARSGQIQLSEKAAVQLNRPYCFNYRTRCRREGQLDKESWARLIGLYQASCFP